MRINDGNVVVVQLVFQLETHVVGMLEWRPESVASPIRRLACVPCQLLVLSCYCIALSLILHQHT
jgi:hypothetical protein